MSKLTPKSNEDAYDTGAVYGKRYNKTSLSIIFVIWTLFSAIDLTLNAFSLNGNKLSKEELISTFTLLSIRLLGFYFYFYFKVDHEARFRHARAFEFIFVIIFCLASFFTWSAQISMDINRSLIVGLDIAWILRYVIVFFESWKSKVVIDTSVVVFCIVKFSVLERKFSIAYVQVALQMIYIIVLLYSKEKMQKMNFRRLLSVEKTEEALKNILDNIPENIAVLNLNGDLVYFNKHLDVCFGINELNKNETDLFSKFYSVKPREKYFDFASLNDTKDSVKILTRKTTCKVLTKRATLKSLYSNRLNSMQSKGFNSQRSKGLNFSINQTFREEREDEKSNKKKFFNLFSLRRLTTLNPKSNLDRKNTSTSTSTHFATRTIRSILELTSVQEIINFFTTNMHLLKNLNTNLNKFYIFDCKYKENEMAIPKSYEIKVSLANFDGNESFILILRDTTHRDIIATLEANDAFKNSVLKSVSHELRTPLNTNLNLLEIAINDQHTPEAIKDNYLVPAHQTGKLLYSLIKDVLDYSLFLAQKFTLHTKMKDIRQTLKKVSYLFESQAKRKGLEFRVDIAESVDCEVYTDHRRICQILTNLVGNALKFTTQGNITIKLEPSEVESYIIKIVVSDTGCGITQAQGDKIKRILETDEIPKNPEITEGIGMGLMISSMLAKRLEPKTSEVHGIQFTSKPQEETLFWFFIDPRNEFTPLISPVSLSHSHIIEIPKEDGSQFANTENSSLGNKLVEFKYKFSRYSIGMDPLTTGKS